MENSKVFFNITFSTLISRIDPKPPSFRFDCGIDYVILFICFPTGLSWSWSSFKVKFIDKRPSLGQY